MVGELAEEALADVELQKDRGRAGGHDDLRAERRLLGLWGGEVDRSRLRATLQGEEIAGFAGNLVARQQQGPERAFDGGGVALVGSAWCEQQVVGRGWSFEE